MIRINLLAVERERTKRKSAGISAAQRVTLACSVILVLTAAGVGWWFWSLGQQSAQLDRDILAAEQEIQRLRSVLSQVQQFETQRVQLRQRVALIEELQRGRSAPVHMLDEISRNVPDRLWLTLIEQTEGVLTIEGRTTVLTALSDFVAGLEGSGYFARPVEIVNSQVETSQATELVRFTVKAQFQPPQAAAAAASDR
jgi:type IV pilus assembly protein PilN